MTVQATPRRSRDEREQIVLDTAERLFYARGVHEVGMDALIRETGLGKATVYRLFPTKDALIGAYLARLSAAILAMIDADIAASADPAEALGRVISAIDVDLRRAEFRGCPFNNASAEYPVPHPARQEARAYRAALRQRLRALAADLRGPAAGPLLGDQLAVLIDGAYTSAAHLGPDGPAATGLQLARDLIAAGAGR